MSDQPHLSDQPHYVGFWARLLASIIDSVLLMLLLLPFTWFFFHGNTLYAEDFRFGTSSWEQLLQPLIMAVVILLFWIYRSATPGKMLLGMQIVDARSGAKPSNLQFLIRYLAYYLSLLPFGLGFIWIAFDEKKQGFHDKIANTAVVRKR